MLHIIAACAAGLVFLIAQLLYLRELTRLIHAPVDPLRPRIVSWMIWLGLDTITIWAMLKDPNTALADVGQIGGAMLGGWILFFAVVRYIRVVPPKPWEYICLGLGVVSMILLINSRDQTWSVAFAQLGGFIGSIPTFMSVRDNPKNEPIVPWVMYLATAPIQVLAIAHWSWPAAIQVACFVIVQSTVLYYMWVRPWLAR